MLYNRDYVHVLVYYEIFIRLIFNKFVDLAKCHNNNLSLPCNCQQLRIADFPQYALRHTRSQDHVCDGLNLLYISLYKRYVSFRDAPPFLLVLHEL